MVVMALGLVATAWAGSDLPDRLVERATQPGVVLVPPIGKPSPAAGSLLGMYVEADRLDAVVKEMSAP